MTDKAKEKGPLPTGKGHLCLKGIWALSVGVALEILTGSGKQGETERLP